MTFAFAIDDRSLHVFASESEACSYAEGIDVEGGAWLFFADDGSPLMPTFTKPNVRERFSVLSGEYHLISSKLADQRHLLAVLPELSCVEGELSSVEAVRHHLTTG